MRTALRLIPWLVLAGVGAWLSGLWGFLAVAILYGLYYFLLRPRVPIVAKSDQPAAREEEEQALSAAVFDRAAKASASKKAAKQKGG
jgi:hypothetical protein